MQPLIIANWKANFDKKEAESWLENFKDYKEKNFVICSPFTLLEFISEYVKKYDLHVEVGAQDISPYSEGPYTGEVTGREVKEFADYVLIGHSERRRLFNETQDEIANKLLEAERNKLTPILCISDLSQLEEIVAVDKLIIAFEPTEAIGSDNPTDPKKVVEVIKDIKRKIKVPVLYGGSVNADNVAEYTKNENIDGVLVGGESLVADSFRGLLKNA
jgi:triosephosphate isomerase (TIM)